MSDSRVERCSRCGNLDTLDSHGHCGWCMFDLSNPMRTPHIPAGLRFERFREMVQVLDTEY